MKFILLLVFIIFSPFVSAMCGSPAGVRGQLQWIPSDSKIKWCNGYDWVDPVVNPGLSCAGTPAGSLNYVSSEIQFCDGAFWQRMKGPSVGSCIGDIPGTFKWDSTAYLMKFCDGVTWYAMYAPGYPEVSGFSINGGATDTSRNILEIDLSAYSPDAASNITHFCFKYSTTLSPPAAPAVDDTCWVPVNFPSPGIDPSTNISFSNFFYSIGFTPATYTLFGWVKNGVGYISSLSNSGNGSDGTDMGTIDFDPGAPPVLTNVFSTNSDSALIPPGPSDLVIPAGTDVYIKWKLTDDKPLPSTPIDIYYTTDEVNYILLASGLPNSAGAGCTADGTNSTGCYKWNLSSPTSGYFKVRVQATDDANLSGILSAEPNNMGLFKVLAGTTDPGLGGSAASAVIFNRSGNGYNSGAGCFVVRDNGMMFICDDRGLMVIDPSDGNYKLFLPITGANTDGPLSSATLEYHPVKIALDYNDRLLIYDRHHIRRVDFSTNQVTSIIGGGGSNSNGTSANDFQLIPIGVDPRVLFTPLPNGDIWFQTGADFDVGPRSAGIKLRIYKASDNKVYILTPTGTGSLEDPAFDPSGYSVYNFGISFNPITSAITGLRSRSIIPTSGGHDPRSVSYNPVTGVATAPHIPYRGYWTDDATINSRNGEMYYVDRFGDNGIFKYDAGTSSWIRLLGTGVKGQCPDGTPALSCSVEVTDAFINSQNQIFFLDRKRVRTIDASGNVLTLFGQSLAFGDGGFAASARVNEVIWLDQTAGGKIAFVDNKEFVLREFTPGGTINKLAGNGADQAANTVSPAVNQGITANYWGAIYGMVADSVTGDIFFPRDGATLSKLNRSTGRWEDIAGGGGTSYTGADGLPGNQVSMDGYPHGPFGFNGTHLIRHFHQWNGSTNVHGMMKTYAIADGTQSPLAGVIGFTGGSIDSCPDGDSLATCAIPGNHTPHSRANWDAANNKWLLHQFGSNNIRTASSGGTWGTFAVLPRGINAFAYVMKASVPHVYYCSGGRMYKYNLNTSSETALFWPSSTIYCQGYSVIWHASRQSVVFAISQNGLGGIAEIYDP